MGTFIRVLGVALAMTLVAQIAIARPVLYGSKPQTVTVAVGTPVLLRFEHPVKTVTNAAQFSIRPASEDSPDYTTMIVEARSPKASSFVTFILADGAVVRTKLVALAGAGPEGGDAVYEFKAAESGAEAVGGGGAQSADIKAVDLMKAMIRGDKVMGYEVKDLKKAIQTGNPGVSAELIKIYAGSDFNGYIFALTNQSKEKTYEVDVRRLRLGEPNLAVVSQTDRKTLPPKGSEESKTLLRVVARQGSAYRDIVLPVGIIKKEKGGAL